MHRRSTTVTVLLLASIAHAQGIGFWEPRPALQIARQEVGAAVLGGKVHVAGGLLRSRAATDTVEVYDPATRRWTEGPRMPTTLHHHGMTALGGRIYTVGGYVSAFAGTARCHVFDPASGWSRIADLPRPRGALVAVALAGKVYAIGGVDPQRGTVGDLTAYDPATGQWTTLAPMPTAREHTAAAVIDGRIYVAGGRAGRLFDTLESFDPATGQWTALAPMPTARGGNGAAVLDGKLVVIGGEGSLLPGGNFPQTEEYDPRTDRWRSLAAMTVPLHGIAPVTIGDEILVAGGGSRAGFQASDVVLAFRDLPTGVARYGSSTPECFGAMTVHPNVLPLQATPSFRLACLPRAPLSAAGALLLGGTADPAGTAVLGVTLHVGLAPPLALLPAASTAQGAALVGLPLPSSAIGGRFFVQFVWANTGPCAAPGTFSTSDALDVTVQPRT